MLRGFFVALTPINRYKDIKSRTPLEMMTNVPNIQGPLNRPDPSQDKPTHVDEHKFKETLHQRVEKTDADQKKQRRQQEEEPEATTPSSQEIASSPTSEGQDSFLGIQEGAKQSFRSSTPPSPSENSSTLYSPPATTMPQEESASSYHDSNAPSEPSKPSTTQEPSHTADTVKDKPKEKALESSALPLPLPPLIPPLMAPLPPLPAAPSEHQITTPELPVLEEMPIVAPLSGLLKPLQGTELDKKKESSPLLDASPEDPLVAGGNQPILLAPQALGSEDPFTRMPPAIQEIFSKMLGVMTIWKETPGVTETSFTLSNPKFASSVFFGTQITIKEFSTAPLAFNVQLNGSEAATAQLQSNLGDLMAAFQSGRYNFKINRLETGLLVERPLFHRKDSASQEQKHSS